MPTRTTKIADDTKDNLSDVELKAARKNPPGDTELSGAAPGAKAGDAPDDGTFKVPKATLAAEKEANKRTEEVREQQMDSYLRNRTNVPASAVETVYANRPEKGDPESITIAQVGSGITFHATSTKMEFDHEGALSLQRAVSKISNSL